MGLVADREVADQIQALFKQERDTMPLTAVFVVTSLALSFLSLLAVQSVAAPPRRPQFATLKSLGMSNPRFARPVPVGAGECDDLVASLRPQLGEALQLARFVRAYPLGFARRGMGQPEQAGLRRYYFHSCMGARIGDSEDAPCEDVPLELAEELPFVVAPDGSRLLYLWPLLLQRPARLTGRRSLYVFEEIPDDHRPFLTRVRCAAIDVKEAWRVDLAERAVDSHDWLLERLRQLPVVTTLPAGLGLAEKLLPTRRGQLVNQEVRRGLRLVAALAAGGFGTIYAAEQRDDSGAVRQVAVKVLEAQAFRKELPRFEQEFAKLRHAGRHPGIVGCYECGIAQVGARDYPWYSMELAMGDLASRVDSRRASGSHLPWQDEVARAAVIKEFRAVCEAVAHLHDLDIVHRDLKPGNVLVMEDGGLRLSDFGLVKNLRPSERSLVAEHSSTGGVKGTLAYMAPEQAQGRRVGKTADVYALGIMLAELATGQRPERPERYPRQGSALERWPTGQRLPEALRRLLLECTQVSPARRPPDARAVLSRFDQALGE
jgi:tRNA A-37 threonylcarbamoyl transferase component Bud32